MYLRMLQLTLTIMLATWISNESLKMIKLYDDYTKAAEKS